MGALFLKRDLLVHGDGMDRKGGHTLSFSSEALDTERERINTRDDKWLMMPSFRYVCYQFSAM